ncbi:MAG TPA: ADOP family duplicated permease [Vicinamibacterales bacterium]|nr:ADOP family duplicated permease [Vicinamibacterales bacterium]
MRGLTSDLRDAVRSIGRAPLLAAVIVGSLAVGIGLNTVVFSWIQARILKPLPGVADGSSLYGVEPQLRTGQYAGASWLEYQDLRRRLRSIDDLIAWRMTPLYVGEPGKVECVSGVLVSPNYFSALRLRPASGRFLDDNAHDRAETVAVISYGLWQKQYAGAESAVGSTLRVNGQSLTVVGVAPREFQGTVTGLFFDVWLPAAIAPQVLNGSTELVERSSRGYLMLGRLRSGVTAAQAQAELDIAMAELGRTYPATSGDVRGEIAAAWNLPRGPARLLNAALGILQGAMLLVLLAVCGNVANLALARGSARFKEMGIRMAIGADRASLVRLLLAETMLMSAAGAALGVALAIWGTNALRILPMTGVPLRLDTTIDTQALLVAIALGLLAGLIIGAAPALHFARSDPHAAFRAGLQASGRSRLRDALMAAQTGLVLMVLIATGISLSSYLETRNSDPGFNSDGVLLAAYDLSGRPRTAASTRTFQASLLAELTALPGVEAAAIASSVPLDIHGLPIRNISVEGRARTDAGSDQTSTITVTNRYFEVMGLKLLQGRDFSPLDDPSAPLEAVANEAFVRRFLESGEAIGRTVTARARPHTIVGVVQDSVANAFGEPPTPLLYFSYRDNNLAGGEIHVRVRPGADVAAIGPALRAAIARVDAELPLFNMRTLKDHVETNLFLRRIPARMFAVIGPLLLLLAAIGIYAVVAYSSSLRRVEVGVRLAMGAVPRQIVTQFLREGLSVIGLGGAIGWGLALALSRRFVGDAAEPAVFVAVPLLLLAVAATACWMPARGASRLDPTTALRPE